MRKLFHAPSLVPSFPFILSPPPSSAFYFAAPPQTITVRNLPLAENQWYHWGDNIFRYLAVKNGPKKCFNNCVKKSLLFGSKNRTKQMLQSCETSAWMSQLHLYLTDLIL
jgi:hypothetical protein